MKTLEELRDLATRWALDHISHHQAQSRVNLAGIGSGLATAQRLEEESKRALDDALRELIADAECFHHLQQDGNWPAAFPRYPGPLDWCEPMRGETLKEAILAARAPMSMPPDEAT